MVEWRFHPFAISLQSPVYGIRYGPRWVFRMPRWHWLWVLSGRSQFIVVYDSDLRCPLYGIPKAPWLEYVGIQVNQTGIPDFLFFFRISPFTGLKSRRRLVVNGKVSSTSGEQFGFYIVRRFDCFRSGVLRPQATRVENVFVLPFELCTISTTFEIQLCFSRSVKDDFSFPLPITLAHCPLPIDNLPFFTTNFPLPVSQCLHPISHCKFRTAHSPSPTSHNPFPIAHFP